MPAALLPSFKAVHMRITYSMQSITHYRTAKVGQSPIAESAVARAIRRSRKASRALYRDTPERAAYRALLDSAAALPATFVAITFTKNCGTLRTMLCQPIPGEDTTRRYVTVWDAQEHGYRRVNLDGIVKVTLETAVILQPH